MANDNNNFVLKFVLTNFLGANISYVENEEGELEECVCIPLERNNLKKNSKNQVSAYAFMTKTMSVNKFGWTHYLKMKIDPNFLKKINKIGLKNPYLGNAKGSNYIVYKNSYESKFVKAGDYE